MIKSRQKDSQRLVLWPSGWQFSKAAVRTSNLDRKSLRLGNLGLIHFYDPVNSITSVCHWIVPHYSQQMSNNCHHVYPPILKINQGLKKKTAKHHSYQLFCRMMHPLHSFFSHPSSFSASLLSCQMLQHLLQPLQLLVVVSHLYLNLMLKILFYGWVTMPGEVLIAIASYFRTHFTGFTTCWSSYHFGVLTGKIVHPLWRCGRLQRIIIL